MSEFKVLWTETARGDLGEIVRFIAENNPVSALSVLDRIEERAALLVVQPERGRIVPELREEGIRQYRELQERPWRIIYRVGHQQVFVLAVLDGRRDLKTLLLERLVQ